MGHPGYYWPPPTEPPTRFATSQTGPRIHPRNFVKSTAQQKARPASASFHAAATQVTPVYKPPVSSDPSRHDISFQIPLKDSSEIWNSEKEKSVIFGLGYYGNVSKTWDENGVLLSRGGKSHLTKVQSLEYYANRAGQERISLVPSSSVPHAASPDGMPQPLRWLHLQQDTLCLNDLRDLIRTCRYLDEDMITVADQFLEVECAKFEKKYSSAGQSAYYIQPGTVLRCDGRYDEEPSRVGKSVFFCSAPYLQLGKQGERWCMGDENAERIHPPRTLIESLYDYDYLNSLEDRDSRQVISQSSLPQHDDILYIPQVWYLLCGSDVLISYSPLSAHEIRGDSVQLRDESNNSIIAVVNDLDNHNFSVVLKTTDSYFSAIEQIDALRSNANAITMQHYDLVLDTDSSERREPQKWSALGHAYDLASYMAAEDKGEVKTRDNPEYDSDGQDSEQHGSSSATLLGTTESRQDYDRRRIADLGSSGIIVNDSSCSGYSDWPTGPDRRPFRRPY
ncbi:hypothetical protein GGS20DRAFT_334403 [Poronia punctata]|nr:hypothetical protein GGS20DRAFT_334403 [Poronia punctata]